jgi:photosystem I P700 chlorophyll a apoprotein A2
MGARINEMTMKGGLRSSARPKTISQVKVSSPVRPIYRILDSSSPLISHLSFISLWLGFHTTGVYVHNDTVSAFGEAEKQILIEPVFSQIISDASSRLLFDLSTPSVDYWPPSVASGFTSLKQGSDYFYFATPVLTPGDFTAHHAIALGLHLTTLILLKGSLDAWI